MSQNFFLFIPGWIVAIIIFVIILIINKAGFEYRKYLVAKKPDDVPESLGTLEGSLLGLMALMIAFTFNMATAKFESRRSTVVEEANTIETTLLRTDLYPDSLRKGYMPEFTEYINARHEYYLAADRPKKLEAALSKSREIAGRIWKRTMDNSRIVENRLVTQPVIQELNKMIDLISKREGLRQAKVPPLIIYMLFLLTFVSAFISGYSHKVRKRNMVMTLAFAVMTTLTLYLIIEMDRPQRGFITIEEAEQKILEIKHTISERN